MVFGSVLHYDSCFIGPLFIKSNITLTWTLFYALDCIPFWYGCALFVTRETRWMLWNDAKGVGVVSLIVSVSEVRSAFFALRGISLIDARHT